MLFSQVCQMAVPGAKSAISDCILLLQQKYLIVFQLDILEFTAWTTVAAVLAGVAHVNVVCSVWVPGL